MFLYRIFSHHEYTIPHVFQFVKLFSNFFLFFLRDLQKELLLVNCLLLLVFLTLVHQQDIFSKKNYYKNVVYDIFSFGATTIHLNMVAKIGQFPIYKCSICKEQQINCNHFPEWCSCKIKHKIFSMN